jgi:hypothetical protein
MVGDGGIEVLGLFLLFFEKESCYTIQAGLELMILLSLKYWVYRCEPPCPVTGVL